MPGEGYSERSLSKELGISNTPVREALLDLSIKGFLTLIPRRGVRVNVLTEKDIRDLYEVRRALETAIVRCITPMLTEKDIETIQEIQRRGRETIQNNDRVGYLRIDREFHLCLAGVTVNRYMVASIENIRDLIDWMVFKAVTRSERMTEVEQEHQTLIDKLLDRDIKGAEYCMEEHNRITA